MTYSEFRENIISLVTSGLSDDVTVTHERILKNNSQMKDALVLKSKGSAVAPTIYLDYFFEKYQNGSNIDDLAEELLEAYDNAYIPDREDVDRFAYFENVKDRIVFRLISKHRNEELLSDVPHYCYLDLAIVFYCMVDSKDEGIASFLIRSAHVRSWNVSRGDLFELARANTPRYFPAKIERLSDVIAKVLPEVAEIGDLIDYSPKEPALFVMTNEMQFYGASTLIYENVLSEFADDIESDLYVIPSSIHETLLLPVSIEMSPDSINEMIKDGNRSLVSKEEILSDHFYYYSRKSNALSM